AAAIGQRLQDIIRLVARMSIDGGTAGMCDQYGLRGLGDGFGRGAVSAMAEIHGDTEFVHLPNSSDASFAEAGVSRFEAAVTEDAAVVVGDLHDAHAQPPEGRDAIRIFLKKLRLLEAGHDANLVLALGASDVGV